MPVSRKDTDESRKRNKLAIEANKKVTSAVGMQLSRLNARACFRSSNHAKRLAKLNAQIKAARVSAATPEEADKAEALVLRRYMNVYKVGKPHLAVTRCADGTLRRVPFGCYELKSGRHTVGYMRYEVSGQDAGSAAGYLGHLNSTYMHSYHGKGDITIWGGFQSTANLDEIYRHTKAWYQHLPRQLRQLGLREKDVLEMVKTIGKDGSEKWVATGRVLIRGIPLPSWFTLTPMKSDTLIELEAMADMVVAKNKATQNSNRLKD